MARLTPFVQCNTCQTPVVIRLARSMRAISELGADMTCTNPVFEL